MSSPSAAPIQETLARPFTLGNGQVIRNRLLKSAMSEVLAGTDNRVPSTIPTLYRRWADGGIGLLITGNVMVDRRALGEPGNICVEDEQDLPMLKKWAEAGQAGGCKIYAQLNHPGRQVPRYLNDESVAPSAVPFKKDMQSYFATPRELEAAEIWDIIERFATTAAVFEKAGFDGVQIHGAHGYLVSQFLSPGTNLREDDWGGSNEKRRRFVIEIYRAIRKATSKDFGVSIKINSADFQKGGISEAESTETILALAAEGMDFIEISGGTYEAPQMVSPKKQSTIKREAYFLNFAQLLRDQLETPLVVTGGFRSGGAMAEAIESGAVDLVGLARTLAVDPDFPNALLEMGDIRVDLKPRKTGISMIDRSNMMELPWYEWQIRRLGMGKEAKPDEHPLCMMLPYLFTNGLKGFKVRRAK